MKRLTMVLSVLALLVVIGGCAAEKPADETPPPSASEKPSDALPSEAPEETPPTDIGVADEIYTKVIQMEGMDETVNYKRIKGSFGYSMPMDVDRFAFEKDDGADVFQSTANDNVYMTVKYIENTAAGEQAQSLSGDAGIVRSEESAVKVGDYDAVNLHAVYGSDPGSKVADHYLIEAGGGVYVISCVYFLEAAEGFGARMYYMTQDFEIE